MKPKGLLLCLLCLVSASAFAQRGFKFAQISDTHVGSSTGAADLRRVVKDINADTSLKFVIMSGDITEFGADKELHLAKRILDSLNKPLHIIPGNHDANWSESGGNSVITTFGAETMSFRYGGYLFLGTASGPFMRMGPGQIPREDIVWLDSMLTGMRDTTMPIVFVNHYPLDSGLNNWYEAIDLLKTRNIQLILCGHGHRDHRYNFEGIPGVMGRSTLRAKAPVGGYNIVTFRNDTAYFQERTPGGITHKPWTTAHLFNHHFREDTTRYPRPSYAVNKTYPQVKTLWQYQDKSDIGSGTVAEGKLIFSTDTNGWLYALNSRNGHKKWGFHTHGKLYSTPAASGRYVVVASSDNYIYCVRAKNGKLVWKYKTLKPDVASPLIHEGTVFIGSSDGHFSALDLKTGKLKWDFDHVKGFVVSRPLFYEGRIYFGCWGNEFYALDPQTGKLVWKWSNGYANRMYSPAVCQPAGTHNRIFIVAPDREMTALNAATGHVIWRKKWPGVKVRESMGLSLDSSLVYVKTMEGEIYGVSTTADT
ncbi:MAG TPA: PQQ-binding-like beta-propeller repeat protein, partial [Chitinophagaceae bacterium]|nr:PQQ-binding-like beta-propeller repeat protein [Chitinophagaceae bacterium]